MKRLNFNNPRRGKQPKASMLVQLGRKIRRKRVAYARKAAAENLRIAQRSIDRFIALATRKDVPIDAMAPLPTLPLLPGQEWIECRQAMGDLRPPVKPAPHVEGVPA